METWTRYVSGEGVRTVSSSGTPFHIWVAYTDRFEERNSLAGNLVRSFFLEGGLVSDTVNDVCDDKAGGVWIATDQGLVHRTQNSVWNLFSKASTQIPSDEVSAVATDGQGTLWIGAWGDTLARISPDGTLYSYLFHQHVPQTLYTTVLLPDKKGGVWVGTHDQGLGRLNPDGTWGWWNVNTCKIPDNYVSDLAFDDNGGLWIATYDGLARLSASGQWEVFNAENSPMPETFVTSLVAGNGGVWAGLWGGGLVFMNPDREMAVFRAKTSGLCGDFVTRLAQDPDGTLWVGTFSGICRLLPGVGWESFSLARHHLPIIRSRPCPWTRTITCGWGSRKGGWLGADPTGCGPLMSMHPGRARHPDHPGGLGFGKRRLGGHGKQGVVASSSRRPLGGI